MASHPQVTGAFSMKHPRMFRLLPPSLIFFQTRNLITTLPKLGLRCLRRETCLTTPWCRPRVTCLHPLKRGDQTPPRCSCIRARTAVKTLACGMYRRLPTSCTRSDAPITPMLSSKRFVCSCFHWLLTCPGVSRWSKTPRRGEGRVRKLFRIHELAHKGL